MMQESLTVAACPFRGSADVDANVQTISRALTHAWREGVQLALFHECAVSGYPGEECPDLSHVSEASIQTAMLSLASLTDADHACVVGAPCFSDSVVTNAAYFLQGGRIAAIYQKQTMFEDERAHFSPGADPVWVDFEGWRIGMLICFDFRFPELMRPYLTAGCDLVAMPFAMGNRDPRKTDVARAHLMSRAAENGMWILACNDAGLVQNAPTCLVSPEGMMVRELPLGGGDMLLAKLHREAPTPLTQQIRRTAETLFIR